MELNKLWKIKYLKKALLEAANWMEHATEEEKNSMTYSKAREIVLERIFNIYSDNKPYKNNDNKIIIREDIPNDFWYSSNKGEKFKVRSSF